GKTEAKVSQLTPIARLMAESEVIVTPKDSPYKSIKDVIDALKKDVNGIKFAGGSAGGIDHELAALLVKAAGGDVKAWKSYVPFAGGGEAAAAIIGGQVQVGISGFGEFKGQIDSGTMKALAVSSEAPLKAAPNIPTLRSQGADIVVVNWRMLAAPPNIPAGDLEALKAIAKKVHDSKTWADFSEKNNWFDNFTTEGLVTFVATETQSVAATGLYLFTFVPLGFVLSSLLFFPVQSRILGSRAFVRDVIATVLFVAGVYLLFVKFLTIDLPHGPLPTP